MAYYKITSLTATLPKRHMHKDKALNIQYRENFSEKSYNLPVNGTLYISAPSLPINLHKLRMKKLITIVEVSKNTFMKLKNPRPIPVVVVPIIEEEEEVETKTTTKKPRKTSSKKVSVEETEQTEE